MRIAIATSGGFDPTGQGRVIPALLWLVERLARRHDVQVFQLHNSGGPTAYDACGARVMELRDLTGPWRKWRALTAAMRRAGPFDVVHGYWAAPAGLAAAVAGRRLGVPSVVTLDSGELSALPDIGYGLQRTWRGRQTVRLACSLATVVTVCSEHMRALARARGIDARVVPLGVDRGVFAPDAPRGDGPPWRLLQVANLNPVKDQITLLQAVALVRERRLDARMDLVGRDTLEGAIHDRAAALGLSDAVTFHGFQPNDRLRAFYDRAHLYVQSSRHEAAGVAVLEAAMCGLPVVGTAVGYVADLAPSGAVAVPPSRPDALAEAIAALAADPARRVSLADTARAWAFDRDADRTAVMMESLYERCRPVAP